MMQKPLVVGNWKMELSFKGEIALAKSLSTQLESDEISAEVVICPSFTSLSAIQELLKTNPKVALGAQGVHWEEKGASTGQISVNHLNSLVTWCIVGHSEQREITHVTDELVMVQANLLLRHGIQPIICMGETAEEKSADKTLDKISNQLEVILSQLNRVTLTKTVIAYEPLWAIGSGETPDPDSVSEIVLLIRKLIASRFDQEIAERVRILYGGSVKPDNAAEYVGGPSANGVLVGGASVHSMQFVDIIKNVQRKVA